MWSLLMTRNGGMKWRDAVESHPFTISTASDAGVGVELVVKRAGDWTKAVYDLATKDPGGAKVRCSIEGPYGMWMCTAHNGVTDVQHKGGPVNFMFPAFSSVMVAVGGAGGKSL